MKRTVLVTGGAGFIGSHLCEKLLQKGNRVIALDNFLTGKMANINHLTRNKEFEIVKCDILERKNLEKIFENHIDTVFHEAAVVGVKRTIENPKLVLEANISGTKNILDCAKNSGCKRMVFASSSEVYGDPIKIPEREDGLLNPKLPYAVSKLTGEQYCRAYFEEFGLKTTSLRYFNVYGPRQNSTPYGFVVGIFIKRVLEGKPPIIFGDGKQTRDFTYIEDCIDATLIASQSNKAVGEVMNIGTGRMISIKDLAFMVIDISGNDLKPKFAPKREFEIMHRLADNTKMKKLLGFSPGYSLKSGLEKTIEWYKNNC
jgi:nucleoside-diphosphate-sugar epimerase